MLVLVLLTTLSISSWLSLNEEKERILKEVNNRGSDITRFVSKSLAYSVVGYDYHTINLLLREITFSNEVGYAKVVNSRGKLMAQTGTLIQDSSRMQLFSRDIKLDNDKLGKLTLGINTSIALQHIDSQGFKYLKREILITLIIILAEFFALSYIVIRPVRSISESLKKASDGNTLTPVPIPSNDEFGQLATQFNALNQQLNDANHQLQSRVDSADQELQQSFTELQAQQKELRQMSDKFLKLAITDDLTNLYNRRYFEEHLEKEISLTHRHGDTVSIIIIDIDFFKAINDAHGHSHGDDVLREIAMVLKKRIRKTDIVCRVGGEEFVVICKRADKNTAIEIAEMLRKTIQDLVIPIAHKTVRLTVSSGIATLTADNFKNDADKLYHFADSALYYSKENGRNAVTHYDDIRKKQQSA
ncbi:diguanylate cyclase (GGDEF domain) with PAS/PAC sensor [hydrothermal vent metagenome]|uniref:Diguanylate cyclase (GGDEF domain) with PAS/PAC sensor n=1 Tax=hydrothermal vent metagenome TaxID=652676 RepID=A0A3B0ZYB2_9ZZZZ